MDLDNAQVGLRSILDANPPGRDEWWIFHGRIRWFLTDEFVDEQFSTKHPCWKKLLHPLGDQKHPAELLDQGSLSQSLVRTSTKNQAVSAHPWQGGCVLKFTFSQFYAENLRKSRYLVRWQRMVWLVSRTRWLGETLFSWQGVFPPRSVGTDFGLNKGGNHFQWLWSWMSRGCMEWLQLQGCICTAWRLCVFQKWLIAHQLWRYSFSYSNFTSVNWVIHEAMPRQSKRFPHGCLLRILKCLSKCT